MSHNACLNCGFELWCLPVHLSSGESEKIGDLIEHSRPIKRFQYLHRAGAPMRSLYVVNSGFLKTSVSDSVGREQVIGFSMTGELVGLDAIGEGTYLCDSIALEDSSVCGIRFSDLEELCRTIPALQNHLHTVMGAEIVRDHGIMLLLGAMSAEERVITFLLNISMRFSTLGYSGLNFRLPMTRRNIGSYLGLSLETVSRVFTCLDNMQLLSINHRSIEIKSMLKLQQRWRDIQDQ